jgi:hypothetical protein
MTVSHQRILQHNPGVAEDTDPARVSLPGMSVAWPLPSAAHAPVPVGVRVADTLLPVAR